MSQLNITQILGIQSPKVLESDVKEIPKVGHLPNPEIGLLLCRNCLVDVGISMCHSLDILTNSFLMVAIDFLNGSWRKC